MKTTVYIAGIFCLILLYFLMIPVPGQNVNSAKQVINTLQARVTTIVKAKIGTGAENIGAESPPEAEAIGPMSFTVSDDGEIFILDQLNSRIQVFSNGKRTGTIKLPVKPEGVLDIELLPGGKIALLDNFMEKSLFIIDNQGKLINTIVLEGQLIEYAPEVTEINVVKEGKFAGVWVRVNDRSVKLADTDGKTVTRVSVPGKLTFESDYLLGAEILGDITAVIRRTEKGSLSRWEPDRTVGFDKGLIQIYGPWNDKKGNIYLGAFLENSDETGKSTFEKVMVVFSPEMKETGRIKLADQNAPYEIFHSIKVTQGGQIYQMIAEKNEILVLRYEF